MCFFSAINYLCSLGQLTSGFPALPVLIQGSWSGFVSLIPSHLRLGELHRSRGTFSQGGKLECCFRKVDSPVQWAFADCFFGINFLHFSNSLWLPSFRDMFFFAQFKASVEWTPFLAPKVDPVWFKPTRVSDFLAEATSSRMGTGPIQATERKEVPFVGGWGKKEAPCVFCERRLTNFSSGVVEEGSGITAATRGAE